MYDLGMLHVARLTLEAWLFTSVQNNRKKKTNNPSPDIFPCQEPCFSYQVPCRGLAAVRANPESAAGLNKKLFATKARNPYAARVPV